MYRDPDSSGVVGFGYVSSVCSPYKYIIMEGALGFEYDSQFPFGEGPNTKAANIKVAVRCRPPLESEIKNGSTFEKLRTD